MEFCDKLVYVMAELNIQSAKLARKIPVDPASVSRWKTGRRIPKDDDTITRIAEFVIKSARTDKEKTFINSLLYDYEEENQSIAWKIARWFFDGRRIQTPSDIQPPQPAGLCFAGTEGFLSAVSRLEDAVRQRISDAKLAVFVSTDHMNLILDKRVSGIWERLYTLNGGPVPAILEQSLDSERLALVLAALLPHIQSGRLLLHQVPSGRRQFCYNLTIVAKNVGLVMAMEPPGVRDASVSMFVDQPSFVGGVGSKLAEIGEAAAPMLKPIRDPADERGFLNKCFQGHMPLCARFGTANLMYAEPDAYRELLKANEVPYESRRWRIAEFSAMRDEFTNFLESGHYREIVSSIAIERLVEASGNTVPDLRFIERDTVVFPDAFIKSLVQGMMDFMSRFPRLEITLTRESRGGTVTLIKEDSLMLLQSVSNGETVSLGSDNWLVINEYARDFQACWESGNEIFGKNNVIYTLARLIERLEASK